MSKQEQRVVVNHIKLILGKKSQKILETGDHPRPEVTRYVKEEQLFLFENSPPPIHSA